MNPTTASRHSHPNPTQTTQTTRPQASSRASPTSPAVRKPPRPFRTRESRQFKVRATRAWPAWQDTRLRRWAVILPPPNEDEGLLAQPRSLGAAEAPSSLACIACGMRPPVASRKPGPAARIGSLPGWWGVKPDHRQWAARDGLLRGCVPRGARFLPWVSLANEALALFWRELSGRAVPSRQCREFGVARESYRGGWRGMGDGRGWRRKHIWDVCARRLPSATFPCLLAWVVVGLPFTIRQTNLLRVNSQSAFGRRQTDAP